MMNYIAFSQTNIDLENHHFSKVKTSISIWTICKWYSFPHLCKFTPQYPHTKDFFRTVLKIGQQLFQRRSCCFSTGSVLFWQIPWPRFVSPLCGTIFLLHACLFCPCQEFTLLQSEERDRNDMSEKRPLWFGSCVYDFTAWRLWFYWLTYSKYGGFHKLRFPKLVGLERKCH